jgi:hypothetical protein
MGMRMLRGNRSDDYHSRTLKRLSGLLGDVPAQELYARRFSMLSDQSPDSANSSSSPFKIQIRVNSSLFSTMSFSTPLSLVLELHGADGSRMKF